MDKKRLFTIMAKASAGDVASLAEELKARHAVVIVKEPQKTLAMIKMREPVKETLFYIGEALVSEAAVELDGAQGAAVTMGDDLDKTLNMAIIDAACNRGVFRGEAALLELEMLQRLFEMKENAMHMKTMVSFNSMDAEVPKE